MGLCLCIATLLELKERKKVFPVLCKLLIFGNLDNSETMLIKTSFKDSATLTVKRKLKLLNFFNAELMEQSNHNYLIITI